MASIAAECQSQFSLFFQPRNMAATNAADATCTRNLAAKLVRHGFPATQG
jgi:hypothetical protein